MPGLGSAGIDRLRAVDGISADARALLRRANRLQERASAALGDPLVTAQAREVTDAAERLLDSLEERRVEERSVARQRLRTPEADPGQP